MRVGVAAVVVALSVGAPAIGAPADRGLDFLAARQAPDGGFTSGAAGDGRPSAAYGEWVAFAVAASGERPASWRGQRATLASAVRRRAGRGSELGDLMRGVVAVRAVGGNPRDVDGRNLVERLLAATSADPTFGGRTALAAWAVLAMRAADLGPQRPEVASVVAALGSLARPEGGWGAAPGDGPDAVSTAAAMHALAEAGAAPEDPLLRRGREALRRWQTAEGGFAATTGERADALTTAWVCTALAASGSDPGGTAWQRGGGPIAYLTRLQRRDGSFRFRPGQVAAPVWVTAQAVLALRRVAVPRAPGRRATPARAPRVIAREPASGTAASARVIVRYRDDQGGTGVDPSAVRLTVNGRDVTGLARITAFALQIEADQLEAGALRLRLDLADRAGNRRRVVWGLTAPSA